MISFNGCASFNPNKLPGFLVEGEGNVIKKSSVSVVTKFLNCDESIRYFDCKTCEKNIQVVFVTISNKSDNTYSFKTSSIIPEGIETSEAALRCARSILVNGGIWPPALVRNHKINEEIKEDFSSKEIKDSQIKSKEELSGVVFFNQINKGGKIIIPLFNKDTGDKILFEFSKD